MNVLFVVYVMNSLKNLFQYFDLEVIIFWMVFRVIGVDIIVYGELVKRLKKKDQSLEFLGNIGIYRVDRKFIKGGIGQLDRVQ